MIICHFCFALDVSKGGVPSGVNLISKQLTKYGIENRIVSTGNSQKQIDQNLPMFLELKATGVELIHLKTRFKNNYGIGSIKGFSNVFNTMSKPDLILLHQIYSFSTLLGYWCAKKHGIPYAVMPHGSLTKYHESDNKLLKRITQKLLINKILRDSNAIVVTCQSEKSDLNEFLQSKVKVVRYGAILQERPHENNALFYPKTKNLRIVFSGRFDKKKNLLLLIKSLPLILDRFPDLVLDIAGSGSRKEVKKVRRLISNLGLERNIQLHGWIGKKEMTQLLSGSRLLILPSENENFALVVAEALSLGIPCVVSKFVGTADIVAKYNAGDVISDLSSDEIARGILKVLRGDSSAYRNASFQASEDELNWFKIAIQWKDLVNSVD